MSEKNLGTGDLGLGTGKGEKIKSGTGKKKIGTGDSGLGTRAQSPEPSPHAASAAGGRPDDVQEEEKWLFDLLEDFKNHFLLSPEAKEEILRQIMEKLRRE